ncbi:hypothetical protein Nepgr_022348 [Nepenthes gracilis]|uniref:Uncharacterized protein n=1 Tax=Nepenthes gracilis TaxID=150966 RepID=A0AAD3T1T1_NEPGR|nr:hypothetical protein Nepgr_022348 [Nepenthes gracilis]
MAVPTLPITAPAINKRPEDITREFKDPAATFVNYSARDLPLRVQLEINGQEFINKGSSQELDASILEDKDDFEPPPPTILSRPRMRNRGQPHHLSM